MHMVIFVVRVKCIVPGIDLRTPSSITRLGTTSPLSYPNHHISNVLCVNVNRCPKVPVCDGRRIFKAVS